MKNFAKVTLIGVTGLFLSSAQLFAVPMLRLSANGGVNWAKFSDSSGEVSYAGGLGNNWTIAVTGTTKPTLGSVPLSEMLLSSDYVSSTGPGTLLIEFSDTYYGPIDAGDMFETSLNSVNGVGGRTTVWSFLGNGGTLFDQSTPLGSIIETSPSSALSVNTNLLSGFIEYSLTMRVAVRHSSAGISTFEAHLIDGDPVPDGGATVFLLGIALLLLGLGSRCVRLSRNTGV